MADVTSPFGFPYPEPTDLVRDGATDIEALAEGVNDQFLAGFQFVGTRYYTSSGTFAKADPFGNGSFAGAKLRAIRVRLVGGGGGGAGAQATGAGQVSGGGGGTGGSYGEKFITNIAGLATSETITRGDGGAGGVGNAVGSGGGTSSAFGVSAVGGGGGDGGSAQAPFSVFGSSGSSGGVTGADFAVGGSTGNGFFAQSLTRIYPGGGGASFLGRAVLTGALSTSGNGSAGGAHGGGGTGARNAENDATARTGGAGATGIVIVDVFA